MQRRRILISATSVTAVALLIALFMVAHPIALFAQEAGDEPDAATTKVYLPFLSTGGLNAAAPPAAAEDEDDRHGGKQLKLIIDTDPGVDDAIALTWLLSQKTVKVKLLGVVTVAGNNSVNAATNNVLNVLAKFNITNVPVVMGASAPLMQPLSKTSWFIHGPDGLWYLGLQNPQNFSGVLPDAVKFYCNTVKANRGATLLALGPLTNIANAYKKCPDVMATLGSVVVLGGAKFGGNKTPVAEFNYWQDPEAADFVLAPPAKLRRLPIRLVPLDTFSLPRVSLADVATLSTDGNNAAKFLAPALQQYITVQIENTGIATIPDAVAAIFALDPTIGPVQPALVKLVLETGQARGQSVVGLSVAERLAMIADDAELSALAARAFAYPPDPSFNLQVELGLILAREPDNALWLATAPSNLLTEVLLPALRE